MDVMGALSGAISWLIQVIGEKLVTDKLDELGSRVSLDDNIKSLKSQLRKAHLVLGAAQGRQITNEYLLLSLVNLDQLVCAAEKMLYELGSCSCIMGSTDTGSSSSSGSLQAVTSRAKFKLSDLPSMSSTSFYFSERDIFPHPKNGMLSLSCEICCGDTGSRAKRRKLDGGDHSRRIREFISQLREIGDDVREALLLEMLGNRAGAAQGTSTMIGKISSSLSEEGIYGRLDDEEGNPVIVGRSEEKEKIIEVLLTDECLDGPSVLVIVGGWGVGKTTLSRLVYEDVRICHYYELRMWINISDNFDLVKVTLEMLGYVSKLNFEGISHLSSLQEILAIYLGRFERFLLVLDDMKGDLNRYSWELFLAPFRNLHGKKGSKILVTTRDLSVSRIISARNTIYLKCLDEFSIWELFKYCVVGDDDNIPMELDDLGKAICRELAGNPLAVKCLTHVLRRNKVYVNWRRVLDSIKWELIQNHPDPIFHVLKLSYEYLSPDLRQAFSRFMVVGDP